MPCIIIIDKTGIVKAQNVKELSENDLYKKAGLKSADGFKMHAAWSTEVKDHKYNIRVYGKTSGRAGQENKYDFPPPIDNTLFFGACVLTNSDENGLPKDLTVAEWTSVYENLFGGFDDIGDDDSEDEEEDDDDDVPRTKEGYVKDGFIVDDDIDEDEAEEEDEDEEDEEEEEPSDESEDDSPRKKSKKIAKVKKHVKILKTKAKAKAKTKAKGKGKPIVNENVFVNIQSLVGAANILKDQDLDTYLDCTSELCEEVYE